MEINQNAINISNLSKKYTIGKQKEGNLRHALSGIFKNKKSNEDPFWALKNISFKVQQGEVIGIIGKNGAGKSTLLKVLSKITQPTTGRIEINGRVASLLEVGTGFHPELTGRENIYLNGTLLGMSRKEVANKLEEIVEFSGVIKFIDTPVKHYSSGMYVRLAFSVAAHLEPEILIIDEVLAVGDAEFQKKCLGKMKDVAGEGRTVIFVSHDLTAVSNLCNRGILLKSGEISKTGNIKEVIEEYNNNEVPNAYISNNQHRKENYLEKAEVSNLINNNKLTISFNEEIRFNFKLNLAKNIDFLNFGVAIKDSSGRKITTINHKSTNSEQLTLSIASKTFFNGKYTIDCAIYETNAQVHEYIEDCISFTVVDTTSALAKYKGKDIGSININHSWS